MGLRLGLGLATGVRYELPCYRRALLLTGVRHYGCRCSYGCRPAARGAVPRATVLQACATMAAGLQQRGAELSDGGCRSMGVQPVSHSRMSLQPGSTSAEPQTADASSPPSPSSSLLSLARSL